MVPIPGPPLPTQYPIFLGGNPSPTYLHYGVSQPNQVNSDSAYIYDLQGTTTIPANAMTYWNFTITNFNVNVQSGTYYLQMWDNHDRLLYQGESANATITFNDSQLYDTTFIYFIAQMDESGYPVSGEGTMTINSTIYYTL